MRIAVDFMPRNYVRINVNWVYGSFYILKGQNVFPDFNLQFWNCFENNDDTLFAKFAASEHSIFYVRQFERNRCSCVRKSVPKIDEKCRFPALFSGDVAGLFMLNTRGSHHALRHQYIRTYLFRRFPALNSIHPFWPTRLWEMISAVVPLNFLFLALLRIYTYDILLHRRFLHFYDFLMIYENSSNFLLKLYDSSGFLSTQICILYTFMYFCGSQTLKLLS